MKKAQITMFFILVIILALIFFFMYQISNSFKSEVPVEEPLRQQAFIENFKTALETCLDEAANEAVFLLGVQGGRIYRDQANNPSLPIDFSPNYFRQVPFVPYWLEDDQKKVFNVSYGIQAPTPRDVPLTVSLFPPEYPYEGELRENTGLMLFQKRFNDGREEYQGSLPALCDLNGPNRPFSNAVVNSCETYHRRESIQNYLHKFASDKFGKCFQKISNLDAFNEYKISGTDIQTGVFIGDQDIVFLSNFPIVFDRGQKAEVLNFVVRKKIRIKRIHEALTNLFKVEIKNIFFDMVRDGKDIETCKSPAPLNENIQCLDGYMTLTRYKNYCLNMDPGYTFESGPIREKCLGLTPYADIYVLEDRKSVLRGEPYRFVFAVENRRPALDLIKDMNMPTNLEDYYDLLAYQDNEIILDPMGFDPDAEFLNGSVNSDGKEFMNRTYNYTGWKATYDENFTFDSNNPDIITGYYDVDGNSQSLTPFNFKSPTSPTLPNVSVYRCDVNNHYDCDHWNGSNWWQESELFKKTKRIANYTPNASDIGPHIVNISIKDSSGLMDWQAVRILVGALTIGGNNIYDNIDSEHASYEDPYNLSIPQLLNDASNLNFKWTDVVGNLLNNPVSLGTTNGGSNEPQSLYGTLELNKSIDAPLNPLTSFFNPTDNLQWDNNNHEDRLKLEITNSSHTIIQHADLYIHQCLPHKNIGSAPYPYHNYDGDDYINDQEDPFQANHACCVGLGAQNPNAYTQAPHNGDADDWGTYEYSNTQCYSFNKSYSFYYLDKHNDDYDYDSSSKTFKKPIPPANYSVNETGSGGPPFSLNKNNPSDYIKGTLLRLDIEPDENDIIVREFNQSCSGNRGNACSGAISQSGEVIKCNSYNPIIGETESCQGPCNPNDPECNKDEIFGYTGRIGDNGGCFNYSYDYGLSQSFEFNSNNAQSFEKNFTKKPGADGICNPVAKCSNSATSYNDGGDFLNIGVCRGTDGTCSAGVEATDGGDCNDYDGYSYDANGHLPILPGYNKWVYYTKKCVSGGIPLNNDLCDIDTDSYIDVDKEEQHCKAISDSNNVDGFNALTCGDNDDEDCWLPAYEDFGNYTIPDNEDLQYGCCGDDDGEVQGKDPDSNFVKVCCPENKPIFDDDGWCSTEHCIITGIEITSNCVNLECIEGDTIDMEVTYEGCSGGYVLQIDATDHLNECDINATINPTNPNIDMNGMHEDLTNGKSFSSSPVTFTWTIPTIPDDCKGKEIIQFYASLRKDSFNGEYVSDTGYEDNLITGGFTFGN